MRKITTFGMSNVLALIALAPFTHNAVAQDPPGFFREGRPLEVSRLPIGLLRKDLSSLTGVALQKALKKLSRVSFAGEDAISSLRADKRGNIFYEDYELGVASTRKIGAASITAEAIVAPTNLSTVFQLNSKPTASHTVYLNFRGENLTGTHWNARSGVLSHPMLSFSIDADLANFSQKEADIIAEVWKRVSEDFAPFDINVTTQRPVAFGPNVGHILITRKLDANGLHVSDPNAAGNAVLDVWGQNDFAYYQPALIYSDKIGYVDDYVAKDISEAASHELGHNLGLTHDGRTTPVEEYISSQGSGRTSWAPIMGLGYDGNVSQWSSGEYQYASNLQDDLGIIASKIGYSTDDHSDTFSSATPLQSFSGTVAVTTPVTDPSNYNPQNKGIINSRTDVDYFYFDAPSAGPVDLTIVPDWKDSFKLSTFRGSNLDVRASLYNSEGGLLSQSDLAGDTYARILSPVAAGRYYLAVEGVGSGPNPPNGYTDYGSVGRYSISGSIPTPLPSVAFEAANTMVSEGSRVVGLSVRRSNANVATSFSYSILNGSAIAGTDFKAKTGNIRFAAGVATATIKIQIRNDRTAEGPESFAVQLNSAIGGTVGALSTSTIGIEDDDVQVVANGVAIPVSGGRGKAKYYSISVPPGAKDLMISTTGGTGDVDIDLKYASPPITNSDATCRSSMPGNSESCLETTPAAGVYYILLFGKAAYRSVTLTASYNMTSATTSGMTVSTR